MTWARPLAGGARLRATVAPMIDTTSLFVHVLAAMGMVGGGIAQVLAGGRLRSATTADAVVEWAGFTRTAGLLVAGSAVLSLLTGGHMAGAVWTTETSSGFSNPFITLGTVALLLLAPVGPMVGGRILRSVMADAGAAENRAVSPELRARITASGLWGPVHSLLGVGTGLVAVMVYKPGWVVTAVVLLGTFALGWLAGVLVVGRESTARVVASA